MGNGFGKYDVYAVSGSLYCYKDSKVLKNRLGIRDEAALKAAETDISLIRQHDLLLHPVPGRFTANHLCQIHRYLFGDIYPFAGHFRREDIMKGSTRFLTHAEIARKLSILLTGLQKERYLANLPFDAFIVRSAYYFAELNYIHPFREGNGRTTREFMRQLFDRNSYEVTWAAVPTEDFLDAMAESIFDTAHLEDILRRSLRRSE